MHAFFRRGPKIEQRLALHTKRVTYTDQADYFGQLPIEGHGLPHDNMLLPDDVKHGRKGRQARYFYFFHRLPSTVD